MLFIQNLDQAILRRFEAVAHSVQLRTGYTNFTLCTWCIHVYALSDITENALAFTRNGLTNSMMFSIVLLLFMLIFAHGWIRDNERLAKKAEQSSYVNPIGLSPVFALCRIFILFMNILLFRATMQLPMFEAATSFVSDIAILCALYWGACTPLPPGTWLRKQIFAPATG